MNLWAEPLKREPRADLAGKACSSFLIPICRTIVVEGSAQSRARGFQGLLEGNGGAGHSHRRELEIAFELGVRCRAMGLDRGAFIAAYTEWTGAARLVTENRDFMALHPRPFEVIRAEKFLARHK